MKDEFFVFLSILACIAAVALSSVMLLGEMMGFISIGLFLVASPLLFVFVFFGALLFLAAAVSVFKKG